MNENIIIFKKPKILFILLSIVLLQTIKTTASATETTTFVLPSDTTATHILLDNNKIEMTTATSLRQKLIRGVSRVVLAKKTQDGAGVTLQRTIGSSSLPDVDPFLLLDEFKSDDPKDYIAGFPDHPHRGFETVTYMLAGSFEHRDHKGNHGVLSAGSVQWMTAGRGIIHSETPLQEKGLVWGFQLWVNLPSTHKMIPPRYQDIPPEQVPVVTVPTSVPSSSATVKVIAGEVDGVTGPVKDIITKPIYLDVEVPRNFEATEPVVLTHLVPRGHNTFVYVFQGSASFGPGNNQNQTEEEKKKTKKAWEGTLIVFENPNDNKEGREGEEGEAQEVVRVTIEPPTTDQEKKSSVRYLLVSAKPIHEPIARRGPFVMNTQQELYQAFNDYSSGKF